MRRLLAAFVVCLAADAGAQTVDFGASFHELDAEATRVITWYGDVYAITERGPDQRLRTRLFDKRSSRVVATADYDAGDAYRPARLHADLESEPVQVEQAAAPRRHTAWANTQLRELWLDRRARRASGLAGVPAFVTEAGVWRMADAVSLRTRQTTAGPEDDGIEAVAAEYPEAMAVAQRDRHGSPKPGERVAQSTFTARMYDRDGRQAGLMRWFGRERVLTWSFPNGRQGTAIESNVPGGFKFTPTLAWAAVQALAFLRQSARPAPPVVPIPPMAREARGDRSALSGDGPRHGPFAAEAAWQETGCDGAADGCTGLHFLDGTIFEECCTRHDLCYERDPSDCCEAWSWFVPNPFWHCARCNFAAVWCFITRPGPQPVDNGGPLGECERQSFADWCPPECSSCTTRDSGGRD
jgi:hypothetical protein